MKVYAFDVDETLECSGGPVQMCELIKLKAQGHIVGLCGNWAMAAQNYPKWPDVVSFIGPTCIGKAQYLRILEKYINAEEYIMVGNDPAIRGLSHDREAADEAGWRFIREADFAAGAR
jgi:hypothetical protein